MTCGKLIKVLQCILFCLVLVASSLLVAGPAAAAESQALESHVMSLRHTMATRLLNAGADLTVRSAGPDRAC
ncbi:MAG: hypothetical protein ABSH41_30675 [Syntrophobacteraceae bacterium]